MGQCQHLEEQMCWVQRNTEQGTLQNLSIMFTKRDPPGSIIGGHRVESLTGLGHYWN